jgi:hypothetical protein
MPAQLPADSASISAQSFANVQAVAAPVTGVATSYVAPTPKELQPVTAWERGFGENTPAAQYRSGSDAATAAIFASAAPDSPLQLVIPAMPGGQAADPVVAQPTTQEGDEAAPRADGQPRLAPEGGAETNARGTPSVSRTQQPRADSAAGSAVELSGSTVAALMFAWQLRADSAAAEKERRGVGRTR